IPWVVVKITVPGIHVRPTVVTATVVSVSVAVIGEVGLDVELVIAPAEAEIAAAIVVPWRRSRNPTNGSVTLRPDYVSGSPCVTGDPNPTKILGPNPVSIMIGSPTPRLIRAPGWTILCINPVPLGIRTPVIADIGAPNATKRANRNPATVLAHRAVKVDLRRVTTVSRRIRQVVVVAYGHVEIASPDRKRNTRTGNRAKTQYRYRNDCDHSLQVTHMKPSYVVVHFLPTPLKLQPTCQSDKSFFF